MPYTPQTWTDGPGGATPISAARLAVLENGVAANSGLLAPTGAAAESLLRSLASGSINLVSGTLMLTAIPLRAGQVVTNLSFISTGTPAGTPTHWFFALYSQALALLGQTADQVAAAWAANTLKTLALAAPYTVPTTGVYYAGVMVAATTPPTIAGGPTMQAGVSTLVPLLTGNSSAGLVATAPGPAGAITAGVNHAYCYAS